MMLGPYPLNSIITGDARELAQAIPDESVDLVVTSPPYNCRKDYGIFDDQVPWPEYYKYMGGLLDELYRVLVVGGVIAINIPGVVRWQSEHRYASTWGDFDPTYKSHRNGEKVTGKGRIEPIGFALFEMMRERDNHMREPIVWVKGSEGNAISSDYRMGCDSDPYMRPAHELILLGSKGRWFHRGGTGRRGGDAVPFLDETKDVWFMTPARDKKHSAVFPVELPERIIKLFTHAPDAIVLDPFIGIGTTAKACQNTMRQWLGFELDPLTAERAKDRVLNIQLELA